MPSAIPTGPIAGRKITIQLDPDDDTATVELTLVEELITEENTGQMFVRRVTSFHNGLDEDTSRVIAVREITHKKRLPGFEWRGPDQPPFFSDEEDDEDDPTQKIKVEVIFELTTEEGSGPGFRRRIYEMEPIEPLKWRKGHIKRIRNKDNPDLWIDVFRKDQFIEIEGSGPNFNVRFITVYWPDVEDDNPFDSNDLAAEAAPTDLTRPYRLDFLQDVVNINVPGVAEFEIDPQSDIIQDNSQIVDPTKFTASIFFNFATGHPLPGTIDDGGEYLMLQFSGTEDVPFYSTIGIEKVVGAEEYQIEATFQGPMITVDWGQTANFYGIITEDPTRPAGRTVKGVAKLTDVTTANFATKLLDKWHWLGVSLDVSDAGEWLASPTTVTWTWAFEGLGNADTGFNADPDNIVYVSPEYTIDSDTVDFDLLPDPNSLPASRIYVILLGRPGFGGIYRGFAYYAAPQTGFDDANPKKVPMQMFFDGKSKMDYSVSGIDGKANVSLFNNFFASAPNDSEGILVKGAPIAIPKNPTQLSVETETRLNRYQVWFGVHVDFNDSDTAGNTNLDHFITVTTDPLTGKKTFNPASLSPSEVDDYQQMGVPANQMLSPAALKYGKPQLYFTGGKKAFVKNRGSGGAFVKQNTIENYAPGPSKIPVAT